MQFAMKTRISFTPEAKAIFGDQPFAGDQVPRRMGPNSAIGDLVRFPSCTATFVVAQRVWTYGPDFEEIQLILEVNDTPGLEAVK